jgi:negative regulator of replication initiation
METISIDKDVYNHLQKKAKGFVDTPNDVLRRILDIKDESKKKYSSRQFRVNMNELIANGYLHNNQRLSLKRTKNSKVLARAHVKGNAIVYKNEVYSLSKLATIRLMAKSSVRGTSYWYTDSNISITDMYKEMLSKRNAK